MKRACLNVVESALACAVLVAGCGPVEESSSAAIESQAVAQAAFVDLGNGMVYDEALDVTWLRDARYAQTSGFDADGLMTFDEATTWASALVFGGTGGWRLPTFDPSNTRPPTTTSANEIGSLLGALTDWRFTWPSPPDTSPFIHVLDRPPEPVYWTGLAGDPGFAWDYHMDCG